MPTYTLLNTETDEMSETFCSWSELESFLEEHPTFKTIINTALQHLLVVSQEEVLRLMMDSKKTWQGYLPHTPIHH